MLQLTITNAGLDALVDAQDGVTDPIVITEMAITETAFVPAPTLIAIPGEVKRITTVAGESVSENVIHLNVQDSTADTYALRGFGLFLDDGTLFAAYGQTDPILTKVDIAAFLVSFDVAFADAVDTAIEFGDATFLFPPATETVKGAIEIATQDEVDTGTDPVRAVTPLTLATRLAPLGTAIADEAAARAAADTAIEGRTVTGSGLVTGGGDLSANRVLQVQAASAAEIVAGTEAGKAVTPLAMAQIDQGYGSAISIHGLGGAITKMGLVTVSVPAGASVTFPVAFPTECDAVLLTPLGNIDEADERDEPWWVSGMSLSGFTIATFDDGNTINFRWVAFGH